MRADFVAYRHLIRAKVRSEAKYPVSFVSHLVAQTLILGLDLLAIWVLFQQVPTLGGWTSRQVLYLYGISGTAFGLADIFVSAIERTTEYVRLGTFDRFLLRPMSTLIQLEAQEFEQKKCESLTPFAELERKERVTRLMELVKELPKNQQEVVRLRFHHHHSYQEISDITGLSVGNVGFLLNAAMRNLRTKMERDEKDEKIVYLKKTAS